MATELSTQKRRQYRTLVTQAMGIGVAGLMVAVVLSIFIAEEAILLAGLGIYWLGILSYLVIWQQTGVRLFDERETYIERRAGHAVMLFVTFVTIIGIPAVAIAETLKWLTVPAVLQGAIWAYVLLLVGFSLTYGYYERQS
jgi:type II secretory pathway component PulM